MSNLWSRFDSIVTPDEVVEAKSQFSSIEEGVYKVTLEELAPAENKDGLPMLKGKFRMVEGNRIIFYNQNLQNLSYPQMTAVNIAEAVTFISDLTGEEYEFDGLARFADFITTIPLGEIYHIQVTYGAKDLDKKFPKLKIVEEPEVLDLGSDTEDTAF